MQAAAEMQYKFLFFAQILIVFSRESADFTAFFVFFGKVICFSLRKLQKNPHNNCHFSRFSLDNQSKLWYDILNKIRWELHRKV